MTPSAYIVSGNGPEGSSFSVNTAEMETEIGRLVLGEWQITAEAMNASGDSIGQGIGNASVESSEVVTVDIIVSPLSGTGTLNLEIHWQPEDILDPSIQAELLPEAGDSIPLNFTIDGSGTGTCTQTDIYSGYYTVTIKLFDNAVLKIGAVEVVRIVKDKTTGKSKGFGFIEMENTQVAEDVIKKLNGKNFDGRKLYIKFAEEKKRAPEGIFARERQVI